MDTRERLLIAILIGVGLASGYLANGYLKGSDRPIPLESVSHADLAAAGRNEVAELVLISNSSCPVCKEARSWLSERKIPYVELMVDRSEDAKKAAQALSVKIVPTFIIGTHRVNGFHPEHVLRLWAEHSSHQSISDHP